MRLNGGETFIYAVATNGVLKRIGSVDEAVQLNTNDGWWKGNVKEVEVKTIYTMEEEIEKNPDFDEDFYQNISHDDYRG